MGVWDGVSSGEDPDLELTNSKEPESLSSEAGFRVEVGVDRFWEAGVRVWAAVSSVVVGVGVRAGEAKLWSWSQWSRNLFQDPESEFKSSDWEKPELVSESTYFEQFWIEVWVGVRSGDDLKSEPTTFNHIRRELLLKSESMESESMELVWRASGDRSQTRLISRSRSQSRFECNHDEPEASHRSFAELQKGYFFRNLPANHWHWSDNKT